MTTFPTIHINGTSKEMLFDGYVEAINKLEDAMEAFRKIEFNARDYYVQGDSAFAKAREERAEHFQALIAASVYLTEIAIHISKAGRD